MSTLLILGAGRSSSSLIRYALTNAREVGWNVVVGDISEGAAREKIGSMENGKAIAFDIQNGNSDKIISEADIVVSLLPPHLHPIVAKKCLRFKKHLLNASYVSDEMRSLNEQAREQGVLLLNECGLDPGIDHMSAMQVIDSIRNDGGKLVSFESFTGGLIAPETDPENPWRYKFTWNPRNVVMAGQSVAKYLEGGRFKYIPYQQLFKRAQRVLVPGFGAYEGYANRDSLKYIATYGLHDIQTMLRGTLRNEGFCAAWNILVQLGCCDDTYEMDDVSTMTHKQFLESFLPGMKNGNTSENIAKHFGLDQISPELQKLQWSEFFDDTLIGLDKGTPAQVTEHILNKRWRLQPSDRDQIVMWHRFRFEKEGILHEKQSSLVATGVDATYTAMAETVGLPLGIAAKLLAQNKLKSRGVVIPTTVEYYTPILAELQSLGIVFNEM